ncbi:MAG: hypothetical protein J5565_05990 [Muribaculaceae bacterium]|nr:hypothetical protein [Muribaculaceae bacterium]
MKKVVFVLLSLIWATSLVNAQEQIALFNASNFDGWTFVNNAGIELDRQSINRGRIALLTTVQGNVQKLVSPALDCRQVDSLRVEVQYRIVSESYKASKVLLQIAVRDEEENLKDSIQIKVPSDELEHQLAGTLPVPHANGLRLHFTAPYADKDNCGAIIEAKVLAYKNGSGVVVVGDVDGDGKVDVSDVNVIINVILEQNTDPDTKLKADLDGDGKVDVSDVNKAINLILEL